jgi:transcriptional regulator with XRE-family HTH domain
MKMEIAENLRKLRQAKGFSQSELARRAGISPVQISQYERSRSAIGVRNLLKISAVLGCAINDIDERIEKNLTDEKLSRRIYVHDDMLFYLCNNWEKIPLRTRAGIIAETDNALKRS